MGQARHTQKERKKDIVGLVASVGLQSPIFNEIYLERCMSSCARAARDDAHETPEKKTLFKRF
eukprot:scaffold1531_cov111-Isochrysis_galbana.AAC.6